MKTIRGLALIQLLCHYYKVDVHFLPQGNGEALLAFRTTQLNIPWHYYKVNVHFLLLRIEKTLLTFRALQIHILWHYYKVHEYFLPQLTHASASGRGASACSC